jgi:hypothetical protein
MKLHLAAAFLLIAAVAPQATEVPARHDEHRTIGGWVAESYGEEENSRAVRISRSAGPLGVEYLASYWHGNRGPYFQVSARRGDTLCGGEEWRRDPGSDVWRAETDVAAAARDARTRLAAALAACGAGADESAALLTGFERAFRAAAQWAEADRVYVLAVGQAIADYGRGPAPQ